MPALPARDRPAHAGKLSEELQRALRNAAAAGADYLALRISADDPGVVESLGSSGGRLATVARPGGAEGALTATVIVPAGRAEKWLGKKIEDYRSKNTKKGRPANEKLIESIDAVSAAGPEDIFTGPGDFPAGDGVFWWQVWLAKERAAVRREAAAAGVQLTEAALVFPDSIVVLARATRDGIAGWMRRTGAVLELRRPEVPAILGLPPHEQVQITGDLAAKLDVRLGDTAICLLDAGVTRAHVLIGPAAAAGDIHAYGPGWPVDDMNAPARGHGTGMAGLVLYGDLAPLVAASSILLAHRIESVRVLPPQGANDPELYGVITRESAARPEVSNPKRQRVFCMAVTAEEASDGLATAWSAAVDDVCFNDGAATRLLVVSAGNRASVDGYPDGNDLDAVQDPAQAWNALTVGAYTEKDQVGADPSYAGWAPVAPVGGLSPASRTSVSWTGSRDAPIKPDIVMEGGNRATDGEKVDAPDSLQLLTSTAHHPGGAPFQTFGDTSAAAALAARLAAEVRRKYPNYWPETVRGLIVHAASWTGAMQAQAGQTIGSREPVLRRYGYGVPDPRRALHSFSDDVTLVAQHQLRPFTDEGKTGGMVLHALPWPAARLRTLAGLLQVELRVTLSYFIQPKPGRRGGRGKYQYPSHQLRFELKGPDETPQQFLWRINRLAEAAGGGPGGAPWDYGTLRNRGSLHSDIWRGDAEDLAKRDRLAVFPASGWWKTADPQAQVRPARYSLVVSLRALETIPVRVDLYQEIQAVITAATVAVQT
ncbi:MAG: S8 family peptidase [Terriglobales bacterium]